MVVSLTASDESAVRDTDPPRPDDVEISSAQSVIHWVDGDGHTQHLSGGNVTFDLHYDASSPAAFFKLRASVELKARPRVKSALYLYIAPERIQSLSVDDDAQGASAARETLSTSTTCLRFMLDRPAALVVPEVNLTPKNTASGLVLDSLRALNRTTSFAVSLSSRTLPAVKCLPLCEAVSCHGVGSIAKHAETARLDGGRGAKVIEGDTGAGIEPPIESPPSYDELGPGPPVPDSGVCSFSKKRRRGDSDIGNSACVWNEKMIDEKFAQMQRGVIREMDNRIRTAMHEIDTKIHNVMQDVDTRIQKAVHDMEYQITLDRQEELERALQEMREETQDALADEVDDQVCSMKEDLKELVNEEANEAEGRLEDRVDEKVEETVEAKFDETYDDTFDEKVKEKVKEILKDYLGIATNAISSSIQ